jgi:hypothetical protein
MMSPGAELGAIRLSKPVTADLSAVPSSSWKTRFMRGSMLRPITLFAALLASTLACQGAALAQAPAVAPAPANAQQDPDEVLAENAQMRLTRADYDADIQRLPAEMRDEFASDKKRLATYLSNLVARQDAGGRRAQAGLENDP